MARYLVVAGEPERELDHVEPADIDSSGPIQPLDDGGRHVGHEVAAEPAAGGADPALAVEHVLVRERHAGQRPERCAIGARRIELLGGGQRIVTPELDDGVELGPMRLERRQATPR